LPSLNPSGSFNASWSDVVITAKVGSDTSGGIAAESLSVSASTSNGTFDLWSGESVESLADLSLGLSLQGVTVSAPAGEKMLSFTGSLTGAMEMLTSSSGQLEPSALTDANFNGSLNYDGQTIDVNLSLVVDQLRIDDITPFIEQVGFEFQEGQVVEDFITITASVYSTEMESESAIRYDVEFINGNTASYVINQAAIDDYALIKIWTNWDQTEGQYELHSSNSLAEIESVLKQQVLSSVFMDSGWYRDETGNVYGGTQFFDGDRYADGFLDIYASIDLTAGLPSLQQASTLTTQWSYKVEGYDLFDQMPSYENHNRYSARAEVSLTNFKDAEGVELGDATLAVQLERSGYLNASGAAQFALTYGDQTFTAHYTHPDVSNEYAYSVPRRFVFSDNAGGMIEFKEPQYNSDVEGSLATPYRANLYYNGIEYGYLTRSWTGDWLVGYHDETEDRVYSAR
jgi:hypothetical protein